MRPNQSSITAENNAVLRAFESMRPESQRICYDPYASHFLPERFLTVKNKYDQMQQLISGWETVFPGVCNAIIARTRFIDDCLNDALGTGIQQLVILGAGYDTRALRFEALKDTVTVFELDHPATQKVKLERIDQYVHSDVSHIRFVPVDFDKETLDVKLFVNGYDPALKTIFIWEGVTYYIPATSIDRTLFFIANNSAPKSTLVFDYFSSSVANGSTHLPEARALREGLKLIGEKIQFGITPGNLPFFMGARGFEVVRNFTSAEYQELCLGTVHAGRDLSKMFVFAKATVI